MMCSTLYRTLEECILVRDVEFGKEIESAISWAKERLGLQEYPLRCLAFVEDAYERSNGIEMWGGSDARESAGLYDAHKNTGAPPAGAFVFMLAQGWWTVSSRIGGM